MRRVGGHGRWQSRQAEACVHAVTPPTVCAQLKRRAPCRALQSKVGLPPVLDMRFAVLSKVQPLQHRPRRRRRPPAAEAGEWKNWREDGRQRWAHASRSPSANCGQRQTVVRPRLGESAQGGRPFSPALAASMAQARPRAWEVRPTLLSLPILPVEACLGPLAQASGHLLSPGHFSTVLLPWPWCFSH